MSQFFYSRRFSRLLKLDRKTSLCPDFLKMFKRPGNLDFPQVFYTFKAKDKNSDDVIEYRVQDLPEEFYDQAADFMVKYFLPDETFCSSRDIPNKPIATEIIRQFWNETIKHKLSIACFRNDGSDELVGANVLTVSSKNDPEEDLNQVSCCI